MRGKSSVGNHLACSHSSACGLSSRSTKRRIDPRSSSCSALERRRGRRAAAGSGTPFAKALVTTSSSLTDTWVCVRCRSERLAHAGTPEAVVDGDVIRALFAAFTRRDVDAALALVTDDVEFWPQGTARVAEREAPLSRSRRDPRRYFDDVAAIWEQIEIEPQSIRSVSGGCTAFGVARGRTVEGEEVDTAAIWVFRLDGRQGGAGQGHPDRRPRHERGRGHRRTRRPRASSVRTWTTAPSSARSSRASARATSTPRCSSSTSRSSSGRRSSWRSPAASSPTAAMRESVSISRTRRDLRAGRDRGAEHPHRRAAAPRSSADARHAGRRRADRSAADGLRAARGWRRLRALDASMAEAEADLG